MGESNCQKASIIWQWPLAYSVLQVTAWSDSVSVSLLYLNIFLSVKKGTPPVYSTLVVILSKPVQVYFRPVLAMPETTISKEYHVKSVSQSDLASVTHNSVSNTLHREKKSHCTARSCRCVDAAWNGKKETPSLKMHSLPENIINSKSCSTPSLCLIGSFSVEHIR